MRARRCSPIASAPAPSTDAYYAAFQIPDLLNYLLAGGALSIAFLPLYTRIWPPATTPAPITCSAPCSAR